MAAALGATPPVTSTTAPTTAPAAALAVDATKLLGVGSGPAASVVFLIDESGSMVSVLGQVKQELKSAVGQLDASGNGGRTPSLDVIFFSDGDPVALYPDGPRMATPDVRRQAADFIDGQVSTGGTQPMPAIKLALAKHPAVIYFVTDGLDQIADLSMVTDAFKRGTADGKTKVHCVFLKSDDDPKLVEALKRVAADSHGTYKEILKKDM